MTHSSRRALTGAVGIALTCVASVGAQVARGVVTQPGTGRPLPGVVVLLTDSAGTRLAAALTDSAGSAALRAPASGRYRLTVERVGHSDVLSPLLDVTESSVVVHRFELREGLSTTRLRTVRVTTAERCERRPRDGATAADLWNEARKALTATALTEAAGLLVFRVRQSTRVLHPTTLEPLREEHWEREAETDVPFRSAAADALALRGFVWTYGDGSADYHGPDAATLLSDEFLNSHCLRVRGLDRAHRGLVGLGVEPIAAGEQPDISGTLWLDERSAKLRAFEYRYVNLRLGVPLDHVGGRIEFDQTPDGRWIVRRWRIRSPLRARLADGPRGGEVVLTGIQERAGEVRAVRPAGTLGVRFGSLAGVAFDSVERAPLSGARVTLVGTRAESVTDARGRFRIDSIAPGVYDALTVHPRIDSLLLAPAPLRVAISGGEVTNVDIAAPTWGMLASAHCADTAPSDSTGMTLGIVRDADGRAVAGVPVSAGWAQVASRGAQAVLRDMVAETRTDASGRYVLCQLPVGRRVALQTGRGGRAITIRVDARPKRADLVVPDSDAVRGGRLGGAETTGGVTRRVVQVIDSAGEPVVAGDIELLRSGFRSVTNEGGVGQVEGRMGATDLMRVRRLGFKPRVVAVEFSVEDTVPVRVVLEPLAVVVGEVVVTADRRLFGRQAGFAERRRVGLAPASRYVTRDDIERRNPSRLADMIATIPGFMVDVNGRVATARGAVSLVRPCNVQVYVDGAAYDDQSMLGLLQPHDVEAIEAYHASEIPQEYNRTGSACGVILIWTR